MRVRLNLVLATVLGCGGGDSKLPSADVLGTATIGPAGGVLSIERGSLAGTTLTFPAGALSRDVTFRVAQDADPISNARYVTATPTLDVSPRETFARPVAIRMPVPATAPPGCLLLQREQTSGAMQVIPAAVVRSGSLEFAVTSSGDLALAHVDGIKVNIENKTGWPAEDVYVTVAAQDEATPPVFYYLDLETTNQMEPFPKPDPTKKDSNTLSTTDYTVPLSKLSASGDGKAPFVFNAPKTNMVSGRIYFSYKQGVKIGLVNTLDGDTVTGSGLQSPPFGPGQDTPFDKVELSCTNALYFNVTNVDYFSFSLAISVDTLDGKTLGPVGFDRPTREIMTELLGIPAAFRGRSKDPGQGNGLILVAGTARGSNGEPTGGYTRDNVLRVLAPNHVIAQGAIDSTTLASYLDASIASGWTHFSAAANRPAELAFPPGNPQFKWRFLDAGDASLPAGNAGTSADQLVFECTYCSDPVEKGGKLTGLGEISTIARPTSEQVFSNEGGPLANAGTDGRKRLNSLVSAAISRGVFADYARWGMPSAYYQQSSYNEYSKALHRCALPYRKPEAAAAEPLCYAFGYDDVYGQDPTLSTGLDNIKQVTITLNDALSPGAATGCGGSGGSGG